MDYHPFLMGANIVAYQKNNKQYGMCCSWAQMIDYDKISMLIGQTSITGKNLVEGQIVGISALASDQSNIALHFGNGHSNEVDKFSGISYQLEQDTILINGSKVTMKCIVKNILSLPRMKEDFFVIMDILTYHEDQTKIFLNALEVL